jgi:hypothetical protein
MDQNLIPDRNLVKALSMINSWLVSNIGEMNKQLLIQKLLLCEILRHREFKR